jgi:hypothetical protein
MRLLTSIASIALLSMLAAAPLAARDKDKDPEAQLAKMLAGRTAGEPVECISLFPSSSSTTIDRTAVVYDQAGKRFVNRFEGGCPMLDSSRIFLTRTTSTRLCRGDVAQVMTQRPSFYVGSCIFAKFTPYSKDAKAKSDAAK